MIDSTPFEGCGNVRQSRRENRIRQKFNIRGYQKQFHHGIGIPVPARLSSCPVNVNTEHIKAAYKDGLHKSCGLRN